MVKFISLYLAFTVSIFSAEVNHSLRVDEIISADLKYKKLSMPKKSCCFVICVAETRNRG